MCSKKCCDDFCCIPFFLFVYLIAKFILLIIMLVNVQNDYNRTWEDNLCSELEVFTLVWLIINYVMLGCSFIYFIFFIGIGFCDCDYEFDEYDIEY